MKDSWIIGAYLIALLSLAGAIIAGSMAVEKSEYLNEIRSQVEENKDQVQENRERIYEHTIKTPNVTLTDYQLRFTKSSSYRTCIELKISGENRFKFTPGNIWTVNNGTWKKKIVAGYRVVPESETSGHFYKLRWFCHENQSPAPGEYSETKVTFYHDKYPVEFNYTVTDNEIRSTLPNLEVRIPVE